MFMHLISLSYLTVWAGITSTVLMVVMMVDILLMSARIPLGFPQVHFLKNYLNPFKIAVKLHIT